MRSDVTVVKELGMQEAKCPSPFPSFSANIPSCCLPQSKFPPEISLGQYLFFRESKTTQSFKKKMRYWNTDENGNCQLFLSLYVKCSSFISDIKYKKGMRTKLFPWFVSRKSILKILFYSSIVDSHCCVNFCWMAKWFSFIYHFVILFKNILFHYGLSQGTEYSSLCSTVRTLLFIHPVYNSLCLLIPNSQSIPPHRKRIFNFIPNDKN